MASRGMACGKIWQDMARYGNIETAANCSSTSSSSSDLDHLWFDWNSTPLIRLHFSLPNLPWPQPWQLPFECAALLNPSSHLQCCGVVIPKANAICEVCEIKVITSDNDDNMQHNQHNPVAYVSVCMYLWCLSSNIILICFVWISSFNGHDAPEMRS